MADWVSPPERTIIGSPLMIGAAAEDDAYCIKFASPSPFTLRVNDESKHWNGTLEYSTNTKNWTVWDGAATLSSANNRLYIRGTGNTTLTSNESGSPTWQWVLNGSDISCSGDIETLLDYATVAAGNHPTIGRGAFYGLFYNCAALASAPRLTPLQLTYKCYQGMFNGCTALVFPPELLATKLAEDCCRAMFYNCTSLIAPPVQPATTLAVGCYRSMFQNCTSLTAAPALPATVMAANCYQNMFYGCSSLATAPQLPATVMAADCYSQMFDRCASLITPPALPAATLAPRCYKWMFEHSGITTAPELPAMTLAEDCYFGMFLGCDGLIAPPALPATTLAVGCYRRMFQTCTNLIYLPKLPATTLPDLCYNVMFYQCSSLKVSSAQTENCKYPLRIPTSGTGTADKDSLNSMFSATGGGFNSAPAVNRTYYTEHPPLPLDEQEFLSVISVKASRSADTISCVGNGKTQTAANVSAWVFPITEAGEYTITATKDDLTEQQSVTISASGENVPLTVTLRTDLPVGYTEIEYIESSGTQYIDTGYSADEGNYIVSANLAVIQNLDSSFFGARRLATGNANAIAFGANMASQKKFQYISDGQWNVSAVTVTPNRYYDIEFGFTKTAQYLTVDGETVLTTSDALALNNMPTFYIFASHNTYVNPTVGGTCALQVKHLSITKDGITVRSFVPCYRNSDEEVGMYDTVNDVFYTNAGTGTFIAGPKVQDQ